MKTNPTKLRREKESLKICRNCAYFVQLSYPPCSYNWGDCQKPGSGVREVDGKKTGGKLTWENRQCSYFRPKVR